MGVKERTTGKQYKAFSPRKPKRVELSADECKKLCAAVGLEYLEGYESRVIEHVITDETVDRYGDIVRAKGAVMVNFKKNPTIQFAHDYQSPPVGKSLKVWYDKDESNIKSQGLYFDNRVDPTGRSGVVFNFIASGAMPACSIGFLPIDTYRPKSADERKEIGLGDNGLEFRSWELLEYSPCPVPANPNALQNALKDMAVEDRTVIKDNAEAFKHVLPDEWVDSIVATLETRTTPDVVVDVPPGVIPDASEVKELREVTQKQIEATNQLCAQLQALGAKMDELKNAIAEASKGKTTAAPPVLPVSEPAGDVYADSVDMIRNELRFNS